jgi:hypothetical protein
MWKFPVAPTNLERCLLALQSGRKEGRLGWSFFSFLWFEVLETTASVANQFK